MGESNQDGDKNLTSDNDSITDEDLALSFVEDRHLGPLVGIDECDAQVWRMKERMKTVSVALVLCLNVGVDPPDVIKTQPCARQECWVDPTSMSSSKALEKIGHNLQAQYERWQPRARYKQSLDPTSEEVKKLCISLRKNAKEERVLFHYNGHGVPKPTSNGEIWVFNRTYTQYIPLSIYDLQTWMGSPSIYVYDCSNAGIIVESFKQFANQHKTEYELAMLQDPKPEKVPPPPMFENCIQLAACAANQALPMTPELPADLFTACLTTPIKVALRWFVLQPTSKLMPKVTLDLIDKIPGQTSDRRTMLGELNWIFTAITDTIAWNTLPRDLFQKLFRQDLLVASLFRNYLLAERIMRSCDCTPVSSPALPPTYQHPMWQAWDLALDLSLRRLPAVLADEASFTHMGFFEEQLTAFDVWLELGSETREPPVQLPIVLQVLLSQIHRLRALELLAKFLDLGPWAVNLALSVGIFPYVLKLLQSYSKEVRGLLVFIWSKILAVDNGCKSDLVRDNGHKYFLTVLQDTSVTTEQRTQATFVLSCIVHNYREGQEAALKNSLVSVCLEQLNDPCADLRQWVAICLGRLWDHYEKARWTGVRDTAHEKLYNLLKDPCPEVRAAAVYALGTFINSVAERSEHANNVDHSVAMTLVNAAGGDASPLVRKELVGALQWAVLAFETKFVGVALLRDSGGDSLERVKRVASSSAINAAGSQTAMQPPYSGSLASIGYGSMFRKVWAGLVALEADPAEEVARLGGCVTRYIRDIAKRQREEADNRLNGLSISSVSLPPSPNRTNYLSGESPPTLHPAEDLKLSRSSLSSRSKKSMKSSVGDREEKDKDKDKDEKDKDKENEDDFGHRCLVRTMFIEWASRRFALNKRRDMPMDTESALFYERDWRRTRNCNIRREAIEEQRKALGSKIESQVFHIKTAVPPSILKLHPFDQQIAVAGQDRFAIFDWGTGAKTTAGHIASWRPTKVTALEWINSHDVAMLMVASDDGGVRLWRPNACVSREPTQVTAWQAFGDVKNKTPGVVMTWEQWTQTLITCGDSRNIRFWDVERELRAMDLPTGTDKATTCIDSTFSSICHENHKKNYDFADLNDDGFISDSIQLYHGPKLGMCAIGCADGSVRLFDRRCSPNEARVRVWMEHPGSVLSIQLRDNLIVSGSSAGDVRIYDIRKNDSIHTTQAVQNSGMSCLAIHRSANIYACGSVNQFINVYKLKGTLLNAIRMYEGFMSHRIGPVVCLDFHPLRAALAAGTADCCIDVYAPEGGGRR